MIVHQKKTSPLSFVVNASIRVTLNSPKAKLLKIRTTGGNENIIYPCFNFLS